MCGPLVCKSDVCSVTIWLILSLQWVSLWLGKSCWRNTFRCVIMLSAQLCPSVCVCVCQLFVSEQMKTGVGSVCSFFCSAVNKECPWKDGREFSPAQSPPPPAPPLSAPPLSAVLMTLWRALLSACVVLLSISPAGSGEDASSTPPSWTLLLLSFLFSPPPSLLEPPTLPPSAYFVI